MGDAKIIITVEGTSANRRDVSLPEFAKVVGICRKLLENSAKEALGKEHMCDFLVSDLSHNSPACIGITPVGMVGQFPGRSIARKMASQVAAILSGNSDSLSHSILKGWESLVGLRGSNKVGGIRVESEEFSANDSLTSRKTLILEADKKMSDALKSARAVEMACVTSFVGRVELINLHGGRIRAYPRVRAWNTVGVSFSPVHKDAVIAAIDKLAKISGKGHYRPSSPLPYKMDMNSIEVLPGADATPKLSEMWGCMPNITDGRSLQEYLDDLHGEED